MRLLEPSKYTSTHYVVCVEPAAILSKSLTVLALAYRLPTILKPIIPDLTCIDGAAVHLPGLRRTSRNGALQKGLLLDQVTLFRLLLFTASSQTILWPKATLGILDYRCKRFFAGHTLPSHSKPIDYG